MSILLKSNNVGFLNYLDVSCNSPKIGDKTLMSLSIADALRNLEVLKFSQNKISNKSIHHLMESENIRGLKLLDIGGDLYRQN